MFILLIYIWNYRLYKNIIPRQYKDFYFEDKFCDFLHFLTNVDNINTIFIGSPESGKTSLLNVYY